MAQSVGMFRDRREAGRLLGERLRTVMDEPVVVLAVPRGGIPVAYEVAIALGAPLDVVLARKVGVPFERELALGAIGEGGVRVRNEAVMEAVGVAECDVEAVEVRERELLDREVLRYRAIRDPETLTARTVVVVDDGLATGATMRAACLVVRARGARRIVVAVPVGPRSCAQVLRDVADTVVCLAQPDGSFAVGRYYRNFDQVDDDTACGLLRQREAEMGSDGSGGTIRREVRVAVSGAELPGTLVVPPNAAGVVLFAHGSGSSRHSPRNRLVAARLQSAGIGTLLFDLLTEEEETDRAAVFDIGLLAGRLGAATTWVKKHPDVAGLPVAYFGASTGAAAALVAAAVPGNPASAIVCRGGRPDLAGTALGRVTAPTLLIVGGDDRLVLELNEAALVELRAAAQLSVIPGATHLFEEPGALERVGDLAVDWFLQHLAHGAPAPTAHGARGLSPQLPSDDHRSE